LCRTRAARSYRSCGSYHPGSHTSFLAGAKALSHSPRTRCQANLVRKDQDPPAWEKILTRMTAGIRV
ncbi:MAG TPA: hypothetical protein VGU23_09150, partial [Acidobacteriaceae bacterium]|nr:hypothetical protein [Acidobacteriaceae bacterium]